MTRLQTTVIIHPTPPKDYKPMPGQKYCPCPAFDFPHETTRVVSPLSPAFFLTGLVSNLFIHSYIVLCTGL